MMFLKAVVASQVWLTDQDGTLCRIVKSHTGVQLTCCVYVSYLEKNRRVIEVS